MRGKIGAAIVAFSTQKSHLVLLGLRKKEEGRGLWVLPGGGVEAEESPVEAVVRETLEEVGVELKDPKAVHHEWLSDCGPEGCLMLYYVESIDQEAPHIVATHEFSELAWFDCFSLPQDMWESDRRAVRAAIIAEDVQ